MAEKYLRSKCISSVDRSTMTQTISTRVKMTLAPDDANPKLWTLA